MGEAWHPEKKEWIEVRKREWESFGKDILQAMTEADCFRYGPLTPGDFQSYFFTGHLPEGMEIPAHFRIMSYPVENDTEFVKACFDELEDKEVRRLLSRTMRCYFKNNKSFAEVYCSKAFSDRLKKLDLRLLRDRKVVDSPTFPRIIIGQCNPEDLRVDFDAYLLDVYIQMALACVKTEEDSAFGQVKYLMRQSAHFVEPTGMPGDDTVARQYAEIFYHKFENEIPKDHLLCATWQEVKKCRFELKESRWKNDEYSEEELRGIIEEYSIEFESEPQLVPLMSKVLDDYRTVLSTLISHFKEYDLCESTETFDIWSPVNIAGLLSSGAKQYFSLDPESVLAFSYSFKIFNCAFKSRGIDASDLASITLFVVPEKCDLAESFSRASVLVVQQNGRFQLDFDFPLEAGYVYGRIFKWINAGINAGFYMYLADDYGKTDFSQEELEEALNAGIIYEGFDLLGKNVNFFEQEINCVSPWRDSSVTDLRLDFSE